MSDRRNLEIGKGLVDLVARIVGYHWPRAQFALRCRKSIHMLEIASRVNGECGFEES